MRIRNVVYWIRGVEQAPLLEMSIESVRATNPDVSIYVMAEDCPKFTADAEWWPCSYGTPLMLANLQAQCEFLISARHARGATAFLDCDTLVLKPLVAVPRADLVVTYRDYEAIKDGKKIEGVAKAMPYNYGVIFCDDTLGAKECFLWLRDRVSKYHEQLQAWYGNQRALLELAGPKPDGPARRARKLPFREVEVAYLPCEEWNYTPEQDEDLEAKFIAHFKGGRKELMREVWRRIAA